MGQRQQILESVVRQPQHLEHLIAGQCLAALEYLLTSLGEDAWECRDGCLSHAGQVSAPADGAFDGSSDQQVLRARVAVPAP